jgi:hypothetical protein
MNLWIQYIRKHGSLHVGRRLEYGFALIAMLIKSACGVQCKMSDFMPHYREEETEITLDDAMRSWE